MCKDFRTLKVSSGQASLRKGHLNKYLKEEARQIISGRTFQPMGTVARALRQDVPLSYCSGSVQFSSVQSLSRVWLFATLWTAAGQASLSITNSQSLLKLMSIESVMPSNHLILCCPLLLPPSVFPHQFFSKWVSSSHQVAKVLEFQLQHQFFRWMFRVDFL